MEKRKFLGRPKKSPDLPSGNQKENILSIARKLFAEKGFDKTTVQDIVTQANVNLSLISYYFGGKDNLYYACLEEASRQGRELPPQILMRAKTQEEFLLRLRVFLESLANVYVEQKEIAIIIHREALSPNPTIRKLFDEGFNHIFNSLLNFFKEAQEDKILKAETDISFFVLYLYSAFNRICLGYGDRLPEDIQTIGDRNYREKAVDFSVNVLTRSIIA